MCACHLCKGTFLIFSWQEAISQLKRFSLLLLLLLKRMCYGRYGKWRIKKKLSLIDHRIRDKPQSYLPGQAAVPFLGIYSGPEGPLQVLILRMIGKCPLDAGAVTSASSDEHPGASGYGLSFLFGISARQTPQRMWWLEGQQVDPGPLYHHYPLY